MRVQELLAEREPTPILTIRADQSLGDAVEVLHQHHIGALVVIDPEGKLSGLISERDLIRALAETGSHALKKTVDDFMTREVITCTPMDQVVDLLHQMRAHHIRHMPVVDGDYPTTMVSIREFDNAVREFERQALTDEMTKVGNRRYFDRQLKAEFSRFRRHKAPLSLAILDIDEFKTINDTYGHYVGDQVIKRLATILQSELRIADTVARLGGEEFGIIFPNTEIEPAARVCARLMDIIRQEQVIVSAGTITFTISCGLTQGAMETLTPEVLVKRADQLMYEAKNDGRNLLVVDPRAVIREKTHQQSNG